MNALRKVIYFFKVCCNRLIRLTGSQFVYRLTDQMKFSKLGRRPPELMWQALPRCPHIRYDAGGIQIKEKLYAIGGFTQGPPHVLHHIDVFDLARDKWIDAFATPPNMGTSHLAITGDGERYVYVMGGQVGINCAPATDECFALDTHTREFFPLPKLPQARYSLNAQFYKGRIHVIGGSMPDRNTPAVDYWSLGVNGPKALENEWRKEGVNIPRGGPHRGSMIYNDAFYAFGGQEGDVIALPGDPEYKPVWHLTRDIIYPDTYVFKFGTDKWQRLADMPVAASHTEFSVVRIENCVILVGGQTERRNNPHKCLITDAVQRYDLKTGQWKVLGRAPYAIKTPIVGHYDGWLYITTGQMGKGVGMPDETGPYDCRMWKARVDLTGN